MLIILHGWASYVVSRSVSSSSCCCCSSGKYDGSQVDSGAYVDGRCQRRQRSTMPATVHARSRQHPDSAVHQTLRPVQPYHHHPCRVPHLPARDQQRVLLLQQYAEMAGVWYWTTAGMDQWKKTEQRRCVSIQPSHYRVACISTRHSQVRLTFGFFCVSVKITIIVIIISRLYHYGGGYIYDSTPIRLQFDHATTIRRPTLISCMYA